MSFHLSPFANSELVSSPTKTVDATDNGVVQVATVDTTITLPSTAVGFEFIFANGGAGTTDGGVTINVSPAAIDLIAGNGVTAADNKDFINTDGRGGDYLHLRGDGANGWVVVSSYGTWTQEA